jgi:hypothetical protein
MAWEFGQTASIRPDALSQPAGDEPVPNKKLEETDGFCIAVDVR